MVRLAARREVVGLPVPTAYAISPAKPEIGETVEAGVKFVPPGAATSFLLAVFDTKKRNTLTFDATDPLQQAYYQTGEIDVRGFEIEGTVKLSSGFRLLSSLTALDARVTRVTRVTPPVCLSAVGRRPIQVPNIVISNWLEYTVQTGAFRGLGFGVGLRYIGDTDADAQNTVPVTGYVLTDASIRYTYDSCRFQVAANNLFDRVYVGTCALLAGYTGCNYGDGRRITGSVTTR